MSPNVMHPDAHRLTKELAAVTGDTLTEAVTDCPAGPEQARVARALDEPLLFKGDGFGHTDVDVAPWPRDPA